MAQNIMGRFYYGDIEGKFWEDVQESSDVSFFGGSESKNTPSRFYFSTDDLPKIKGGIEKCYLRLGTNAKKLDAFFDRHKSYDDEQLDDYLGNPVSKKDAKGFVISQYPKILAWYARLKLGEKILTCVEEKGRCHFEVEL